MTKFSGMMHSDTRNTRKLVAKFRLPKVVTMETVTCCLLFNDRYLSRRSRYSLEILKMCAPEIKLHFMYRTEIRATYRFPVIIKQSFRQGPVHVMLFVCPLISVFFIYNSRTRSS